MRILQAADHKRMAWRNGGGETVEIAVHPPGAGLEAFDWRVSMARVAGSGPFSSFPGIERTLCLLDGHGLRLVIEGMGETVLTTDSEPLRFPADAPTQGFPTGGPVTDLNVMTRRGTSSHRVERHRVEAGGTLLLPAFPSTCSLILVTAPCRIEGAERAWTLSPLDALMGEGASPPLRVTALEAPVSLYAVAITT